MADSSDPLQKALLQHGSKIEQGKTTYKLTADDGSAYKIKIEKESPKSPKAAKKSKSVHDKILKVIPWNRSPPKDKSKSTHVEYQDDYDVPTQTQEYESEPVYETIDEDKFKTVLDMNRYWDQRPQLATPTLPQCLSGNGASDASVYETSFASLDQSHGRPENNSFSQPFTYSSYSTYNGLSSCHTSPRQLNNSPAQSKNGQLYPPNLSPKSTYDPQIEHSNVTSEPYDVTGFRRHSTRDIPRHISESDCPNVDSKDWECLCDEYSEYELQEQSHYVIGSMQKDQRSRVYDVPRNLTQKVPGEIVLCDPTEPPQELHNYSTQSNAFWKSTNQKKIQAINNDDDGHYISPKPQYRIPTEVRQAKCPSIDEEEWDRLCVDLFE